MSDAIRISGKKISLPTSVSSNSQTIWKFEARPGGWVIAYSETGARVRMMVHEAKGRMSASLTGFLWTGEKVPDGVGGGASSSGVDSDLIAQFPGKIRKVLVEKGSEVLEGDSLILVEAMKMEFVIRAPFSGTILEVRVQGGQQISPGERFVDLERKKQ